MSGPAARVVSFYTLHGPRPAVPAARLRSALASFDVTGRVHVDSEVSPARGALIGPTSFQPRGADILPRWTMA